MGFLNTALRFTGNDLIVDLFPNHKHLHSETPYRTGYNLTVDVRCKTMDGRHFLVEMQNDFRGDYFVKALVESSRLISRLDHAILSTTSDHKESSRQFWKEIKGVYTIIITNQRMTGTRINSNLPKMEPDLVNPYTLRHAHHLERTFGEIPYQLTLITLANFHKEKTKFFQGFDWWAWI